MKITKSLPHLLKSILPKRDKTKEKTQEIDVFKLSGDEAVSDGDVDSYLLKLQNETKDLCKKLDTSAATFDKQSFFDYIYSYVESDNRLVYSSITNYIFSIVPEKKKAVEQEENVDSIVSNLRAVIDYVNGEEFKDKNINKSETTITLTKKYLLKFWDHVNLAQRQYEQITKEETYFQRLAEDSVEKATKPITRDLISLVGIFTTLSFLVFGGVSSLDNVFSGVKDIPLVKLLIVGSVWGICMLNLIFIFIFFIAKLTDISIKSDNSQNANIVKRYPLVFFTNWLLVTILAFGVWSYWWIRLDLLTYVNTIFCFQISTVLLYYIVIGSIALVVLAILWFQYTKTDKETIYNNSVNK